MHKSGRALHPVCGSELRVQIPTDVELRALRRAGLSASLALDPEPYCINPDMHI